MYNNDYENYMRSVLGYPIQNEMNTYNNVYNDNNAYFPYRSGINNANDKKYESLYPEIYNILKPMIRKICSNPSYGDISNDTIEIMANEIYTNVESDINVINVNINTTPEAGKSGNATRRDMKVTQSQSKTEEARACCGNPTLKDLIKILILNQLLENNSNRPPRPPRPQFQPFFMQGQPYRELENPAIYNSNYNSNQSYQYYN